MFCRKPLGPDAGCSEAIWVKALGGSLRLLFCLVYLCKRTDGPSVTAAISSPRGIAGWSQDHARQAAFLAADLWEKTGALPNWQPGALGLYTRAGGRKYLNHAERQRALAAMKFLEPGQALFALTLAWTGARVSEVLALTAASFQIDCGIVALHTLKRRKHSVREVPVPPELIASLDRHFGIAATPRARTEELWSLAAAVIPKGKGHLINQALMDLGAMICRSRAPRCDTCPLRRSCDFRREFVRSLPARSLRRRVSP